MDKIPEDTSRFDEIGHQNEPKHLTSSRRGDVEEPPVRFRLKGPGGSASVIAQEWSLLLLELTGADFLFASNYSELNWSIKEPEYLCTPFRKKTAL